MILGTYLFIVVICQGCKFNRKYYEANEKLDDPNPSCCQTKNLMPSGLEEYTTYMLYKHQQDKLGWVSLGLLFLYYAGIVIVSWILGEILFRSTQVSYGMLFGYGLCLYLSIEFIVFLLVGIVWTWRVIVESNTGMQKLKQSIRREAEEEGVDVGDMSAHIEERLLQD